MNTVIKTNKTEIKKVVTALVNNNLRGEWADSLMRILFTAYATPFKGRIHLELTPQEYEQWLKYGGRSVIIMNASKRSMDLAWAFVKKNGFTMEKALKVAWLNVKLRKTMDTGVVWFRYQKVDGTVRSACGTLQEGKIPPTQGSDKPKDRSTQVYFDITKNEYRCFKKANLLDIGF